jgi:heme exporter protein B
MVLAKILVHWVTASLPLILIAPVLGLQFDLDSRSLEVLIYSLLLGTPVLSLLGAIGAALTLGIGGGSVLLSLLVLPLYIPVLIFGAGAVYAQIAGLSVEGYVSVLGALLILAMFFSPFAAAQAVKVALE